MKTKIVITPFDEGIEGTVNDKNFKFRHTILTQMKGTPVLVHLQTNNLTVAKTFTRQLDGEDFMNGEPVDLTMIGRAGEESQKKLRKTTKKKA